MNQTNGHTLFTTLSTVFFLNLSTLSFADGPPCLNLKDIFAKIEHRRDREIAQMERGEWGEPKERQKQVQVNVTIQTTKSSPRAEDPTGDKKLYQRWHNHNIKEHTIYPYKAMFHPMLFTGPLGQTLIDPKSSEDKFIDWVVKIANKEHYGHREISNWDIYIGKDGEESVLETLSALAIAEAKVKQSNPEWTTNRFIAKSLEEFLEDPDYKLRKLMIFLPENYDPNSEELPVNTIIAVQYTDYTGLFGFKKKERKKRAKTRTMILLSHFPFNTMH